jgi:hypothetical protein
MYPKEKMCYFVSFGLKTIALAPIEGKILFFKPTRFSKPSRFEKKIGMIAGNSF